MKLKYFVLAIASVLFLAGCSTKSLKIEISKSEKFTEKEIRSAINEVKKAADDYIEGSRLSKLTYDELESNQLIVDYVPTLDLAQDYPAATLLMLNSEIKTGTGSGSLEPHTTYQDYYWLLVKEQAGWKIIQTGFLI